MAIFLAIRAALRLVPWRLVVVGAVAFGVLLAARHLVGQLRTVGELRAAVAQEREARQAVERAAGRLREEVARRVAAERRYRREVARLTGALGDARVAMRRAEAESDAYRAWARVRMPPAALRIVCEHIAATHGVSAAAAAPACGGVLPAAAAGAGDGRPTGVVAGTGDSTRTVRGRAEEAD